MTRRYSILAQLATIFTVAIALFLAILGYVLYSYTNTITATVEFSAKVNTASTRLMMVKDAHTDYTRALLNMRGFLFYPDGAAQYEQGYRRNFTQSFETVKQYNATAQSADEDAAKLEKLLAEYLVIGDKAIAAKKSNAPDLDQILNAGRQLVEQIDAQFDVVAQKQGNSLDDDSNFLIDRSKRQSQIGLIAGIVVTILIIVIVAAYSRKMTFRLNHLKDEVLAVGALDLSKADAHATHNDELGDMAEAIIAMKQALRGIVGQVKTSAEALASSSEEFTANSEQSVQAANQMASSIASVAGGASEQQETANETSLIVEQMSAALQRVAVDTNQVSAQSAQAAEKAHEGGRTVEKAVSQMARIESTVNASAQVVAKLGEQSKEIGQIVDTIAGIAGQTNLLALNAAIEAARAGEQGRGFAVVAEEVRKLAEQSQDAAKQIAGLIAAIQLDTDSAVAAMSDGTREVKTGTEVVNTAGGAFREIVGLVSQVSGQVSDTSAAIQQMSSEAQKIVGAIRKIDTLSRASADEAQSVSAATEEQAASMEEIATSSQALAQMAQDLQAAISRIRI